MSESKKDWKMVIGLEVHVQLNTRTKMFTASDWGYGESPNTQICPVTLGYPGVLPTINALAVEKGMLIGLSLNCRINQLTKFSRKHYFYPDLPKGYQISQFEDPLCEEGFIYIGDGKKINIERAHLEEDAGKTIHTIEGNALIDYNRSGAPLLEIVSGPDMGSSMEALAYLNFLKETIIALNASDCDMEKGNLRVDLNISVMETSAKELGTRREIKNLNSFRNVEKAIHYEFEYQCSTLEQGGKINQETLLWDDKDMVTQSIRTKEDAHDYRYFPEPDLPPLKISSSLIEKIKEQIPKLPHEIRKELLSSYNLNPDQIDFLVNNREILEYFESMSTDNPQNSIKYYNWITIDVVKYLRDADKALDSFPITPIELKQLVDIEISGKIDHAQAKKIFSSMLDSGESPLNIFKDMGYDKEDNLDDMEKFIHSIFDKFPEEYSRLLSGEDKLINFFIGNIMKESKGKYLPANITHYLKEMNSKK